MMAAAATMFAACTQTDFVQEVNTQQAIGFEAFAGKTTRAEIADAEALQDYGFKVWGYTGSDVVFDGVPVRYGTDWSYVTEDVALKYWDKGKTYDFYATAPADAALEWNGANFEVSNVTSGRTTAENVVDYLTATQLNYAGVNGGTVNFSFSHIMSKVSVIVKTSEDLGADATLTSVKMTGWNSGKGAYNGTTWNIATPIEGTTEFIDDNTVVSNSNVQLASYLIVPQTIEYTAAEGETPEAGLAFTLSYTIGSSNFVTPVVVPADQVWGVNQHTTYVFTIKPDAILFGVANVAWDENVVNVPVDVVAGTPVQ